MLSSTTSNNKFKVTMPLELIETRCRPNGT